VYSCSELIGREQVGTGADWALIRLDRKVTGHQPLKYDLRLHDGSPLGVRYSFLDGFAGSRILREQRFIPGR
jgi:hypothetical protein